MNVDEGFDFNQCRQQRPWPEGVSEVVGAGVGVVCCSLHRRVSMNVFQKISKVTAKQA